MDRIALVTGANRGLGRETCRQLLEKGYTVILTARRAHEGEKAASELDSSGKRLRFHPLDVTDEKSIQAIGHWVEKELGRLDALVNNAGILIQANKPGEFSFEQNSAFKTSLDSIRSTLETNTMASFRLIQTFAPGMRRQKYGRIVNVSSGMGQLTDMNGGWASYRISKTALNAVTRIFADELKGDNVLVNSVCPGWVRTDMGGATAHRNVDEGADTIVWAATLPDGGPSGSFFRDRKAIPW